MSLLCSSSLILLGNLFMTPASHHLFLVSHGLFCLDPGQGVYEKGVVLFCFRKWSLESGDQRNVFAMGCVGTWCLAWGPE